MELVSRKVALAAGLPRYFTGRACKRGHVVERETIPGNCVECRRIRPPRKAVEAVEAEVAAVEAVEAVQETEVEARSRALELPPVGWMPPGWPPAWMPEDFPEIETELEAVELEEIGVGGG